MLQSQATAQEPAGLLVRGPVLAAADRHGPVSAAARRPDRHVPAHAPFRAGVVLQAVQRRRDLAAVGRVLRRTDAEAAARPPAGAPPEVHDAVPREDAGGGGYSGRDTAAAAGLATVVVRGGRPVELPETDRRAGVPGGPDQGPRTEGVPDGLHEGPAARDRICRGRETAPTLRRRSSGKITPPPRGKGPARFPRTYAIRRSKPRGRSPGRRGLLLGVLRKVEIYHTKGGISGENSKGIGRFLGVRKIK